VTTAGPDDEARTLPSLGPVVSGSTVTITDDDGTPVADGVVGEVRISGKQVVRGYLTQAGRNLPTTVDDAGRLMTGDLGFLSGGDLFLCGRAKEMIIVGGENFYAEDYEAVVEQAQGVIPGAAAAFASDGERMAVIAEIGADPSHAAEISAGIKTAIRKAFGHRPATIVIVPPGSLPRTPSGKLQRHESRRHYEAGTLNVLHERA
jgi:fatty-acyl-CoA synthase